MAEQKIIVTDAVTPEAFMADRQKFWSGFTHFTAVSVTAIAVLLILMKLFLL